MIKIKTGSVAHFLDQGFLGLELNYENIEEYDSYLRTSYMATFNKNKETDKQCWAYILYSPDYDENMPPVSIGMVYLLEKDVEKYGLINVPLEHCLNKMCIFTSKILNQKYIRLLKIIELAQKYYKETISSIKISVEFSFTSEGDIIIGAESFNLTAIAYMNKNEVNIEKTFRKDMQSYDLENFNIDCHQSVELINMISE